MLQGRRVYADKGGFLHPRTMMAPGSYGRATFDFAGKYGPHMSPNSWWDVCLPNGRSFMLNPAEYTVTVYEDQTITVFPEIQAQGWRGWLECGVWRESDDADAGPLGCLRVGVTID